MVEEEELDDGGGGSGEEISEALSVAISSKPGDEAGISLARIVEGGVRGFDVDFGFDVRFFAMTAFTPVPLVGAVDGSRRLSSANTRRLETFLDTVGSSVSSISTTGSAATAS